MLAESLRSSNKFDPARIARSRAESPMAVAQRFWGLCVVDITPKGILARVNGEPAVLIRDILEH